MLNANGDDATYKMIKKHIFSRNGDNMRKILVRFIIHSFLLRIISYRFDFPNYLFIALTNYRYGKEPTADRRY